jgi:hypothetical protein
VPLLFSKLDRQWREGNSTIEAIKATLGAELEEKNNTIDAIRLNFLSQKIVDERLRALVLAHQAICQERINIEVQNPEVVLQDHVLRMDSARGTFQENRILVLRMGFKVKGRMEDYLTI